MAKKTQHSGQTKKGPATEKPVPSFTAQEPAREASFSQADAVPHLRQNVTSRQSEGTRRAMGGAVIEPPRARDANWASWPFWAGVSLTVLWFGAVFLATMDANATGRIAGLPITSVALGISGVVAPVAFLWMIIAYLQRASDVRAITEPLRRQLQMVMGTGANAEGRIRRFNEALERQLELLRQAGDGSYDVLQSAVQVLQEEERAIGQLAERSGKEIQRVAGIVRDNSEVLEDLLHDNRERFEGLSGKIAGHIATLDEKADVAAARLGDMVDRLHGLIDQFKTVADQKMADCADISEHISRQERETGEAARRMNDMLQAARLSAQELSTLLIKNQDLLDVSGQKLAGRMQDISQEIENFAASSEVREQKMATRSSALSQTLTREISALETLTGRLEAQIEAANEGISSRTGEFETRQQKLVAEAGNLMQSLAATAKDLDQTALAAFEKYSSIREGAAEQSARVSQQFQLAGTHYDSMAERLDAVSRNVAERVNIIGKSLAQQVEAIAMGSEKASLASQQAGTSVNVALEKLEVMIARIFDAEQRTTEGAKNVMQQLEGSFGSVAASADAHVARLNATHERFEEVGTRLALRAHEAEGTWQSLVESAKNQQEALQDQLRSKVEEATGLLNENAHAIEEARDSLYAHVEAGFAKTQDMIDALTMLGEATDKPFNDAVARVRAAVADGQQQMQLFNGTLEKNVESVAAINQRLSSEAEHAGHRAAEALAGFDAVAARMEAIQHTGAAASQDVLARLSALSDAAQNTMQRLSGTANEEQRKLADVVRELSLDINGLIHDSQTADQRLRIASTLLSDQAEDVRTKLETQAKGIENSLGQLNEQFMVMAEQMKQTTSTAQEHISEITKSYNDITHMSQEGLEEKIESLGHVVRGASETLAGLGDNINTRTQELTNVQAQLQGGAVAVDSATQQALDRLSVFTHALTAVRSTSAETAQDVFARLSEIHEQFARQISVVGEGSDTITQSMRRAVAGLVEQSVGLAAASQQAEVRIESIAAKAESLQARAHDVRAAIEGEAEAMQARMETVLSSIESASVSLERNAVIAFDRTEGMAKRFENISAEAFERLGGAASQIEKTADASVAKVGDVNKALMDQVASLTFAGEHLAEVDSEIRRSTKESTAMLNRLASEVGATASYAADQLRQQVLGLKTEAEGMLRRFDALGNGLAHQSIGIMQVADGLENTIARLRETSLGAYEDAFNAGQRIVGSTIEFKNEVGAAVQNMAVSGEAFQQRGDFAITMVHQMASRFTEATQTLRGQFEAEATNLQNVAQNAESKLTSFAESLASNTEQLSSVGGLITASGAQVNETLEKANFLLRGAGTQIDRLKATSQDVAAGLTERLANMLSAFESELKGMAENGTASLDDLTAKARAMSMQMRDEAQASADDILELLHDMRSDAEENFRGLTLNAGEAVAMLRDEGRSVALGLQRETERTLVAAGEHMARLKQQMDSDVSFTTALITSSADALRNQSRGVAQDLQHETERTLAAAGEHMARLKQQMESDVYSTAALITSSADALRDQSRGVAQDLQLETERTLAAAGEHMARLKQQMESDVSATSALISKSADTLHEKVMPLTRLIREETNDALGTVGTSMQSLQNDFRGNLVGMVDTVVSHLKQVQDSSSNISEAIRGSAAQGAEQALSVLHTLRLSTEQEVRNILSVMESSLDGLAVMTVRMKDDMRTGSSETQRAALQSFVALREQIEGELKQLTGRADTALSQLQNTCASLTADMNRAVGEAHKVGGEFEKTAGVMRHEASKVASSVVEASQSLTSASTMMQRSQNALYDVAQKSTEALGLFSENITQQARTLSSVHENFASANENLAGADERLQMLKNGLSAVLNEMSDRVNTGLLSLGQQILSVKHEAGSAAETVSASSAQVLSSQNAMVQTAQALTAALSQLEGINRLLADSMQNNAAEAGQQARQIGLLSQQVQQQVASLENAAQAAAHQSVALSQSLDMPIAKVENLSERLDRTLNLTVMVGEKISGQLGGMTRDMEKALYDLAGGAQKSQAYAQAVQPAKASSETTQDVLNRLQSFAQAAAPMPQPAPMVVTPAYVAPAAKVAAPAAAAPRRSDSELISSLSHIIQQLEETTSRTDAGTVKKKVS